MLIGRSLDMPWPEHPKFLQPNKNDTWNDYQKLHRGKIVTTTAWREARDAIHRDFREYLSRGGIAQVQASDLEEMERLVFRYCIQITFFDPIFKSLKNSLVLFCTYALHGSP